MVLVSGIVLPHDPRWPGARFVGKTALMGGLCRIVRDYGEVIELAVFQARQLCFDRQVPGTARQPDIHGRIYTYTEARERNAIPLGIAPGGIVTSNIEKGRILSQANFAPDDSKFICKMRKRQDEMLATEEFRA